MTTERLRASFEFSCDGPAWKGTAIVGGHPVVAGPINVDIDPSGFPVVSLRLPVSEGFKLNLASADVLLDDETRKALVSLGWTPPAEAGQEA